MSSIAGTIDLHVCAGVVWALSTIVIATTGLSRKWLFALQMGAAFVAVTAGIILWHSLHADRLGPTDHLLAAGTFCALIALGLQVPVAGPALLGSGTVDAIGLERRSLGVYRVTAVLMILAAAAMIASAYP